MFLPYNCEETKRIWHRAQCLHDIDDSHLDAMVSDIAARLPCCGIRSMQSMLRANGIVLQRERVRESLYRVGPVGMQDIDSTEGSTASQFPVAH